MSAIRVFCAEADNPDKTTLQTAGVHGNAQIMKLNSIFANRHSFDGQVSGKRLRLLLMFDGDRSLRLQIAGDGEQMIVDYGQTTGIKNNLTCR